MKRQVCLALVALVLLSAPALLAQRPGDIWNEKPADNGPQTVTGPATRPLAEPVVAQEPAQRGGPVTITYDDGVATAMPNINSYCFGNQFNTFMGGNVASHSITGMTFFAATGAGTDSMFISAYGPVAGTAAPFYEDLNVPLNNGSGMFNTATFGPYTGMGSFLAGVWYVSGDTGALGAGTVGGQGHHGMAINDIAGTDFQTLPNLNALVRARTAALPVELLGFSVDEN